MYLRMNGSNIEPMHNYCSDPRYKNIQTGLMPLLEVYFVEK
jgi:hypothetical protein